MIHPNTFKKETKFNGAKGLLFVDHRIVVMRRDNKTNNFPLKIDLAGGGREAGESPFDTFKREAKEEFGLHIEEGDITFSKMYPSVLDSNQESYFLVAKPKNTRESDIVFGDEGIEFLLMSPEEFAASLDAVEGQQVRVRDYLEFLGK